MQRFTAYFLVILSCFIFAFDCNAFEISYKLILENPLSEDRVDYPVEFILADLAPCENVVKSVVIDGDNELPSQLDDVDGDGIFDHLSFTIDLGAKEKRNLKLTLSDSGQQTVYRPRVWAGFMLVGRKKGLTVDITDITVPGSVDFYNMVHGHGPMFESELAAYRVYFNPKQTIDPYGKRQRRLELSDTKFYPDDKQLQSGYGDDVLLAGNSCGVGAFKGWDGEKATHIAPVDSRRVRLVATGPVRTIVEVQVRGWQYDNTAIDIVNRYTLYAGHRDVKVDCLFKKPMRGVQFATGVQNIPGKDTHMYSDHRGLVGSWGTNWPMNDTVKYAKETIGIATCVPEINVVQEASDGDNFLYIVSTDAVSPDALTYYTMFTSTKEAFGYPDSESWFAYLPMWKRSLETPVKITLKKQR